MSETTNSTITVVPLPSRPFSCWGTMAKWCQLNKVTEVYVIRCGQYGYEIRGYAYSNINRLHRAAFYFKYWEYARSFEQNEWVRAAGNKANYNSPWYVTDNRVAKNKEPIYPGYHNPATAMWFFELFGMRDYVPPF